MKKKIVNIATYKAMKKLLNCYEGKEGLMRCPLCKASMLPWDTAQVCKRCPWLKFECETCLGWSKVTFEGGWSIVRCRIKPHYSEYNEIRLKRIEMLKDWMSRSIIIPFWPF